MLLLKVTLLIIIRSLTIVHFCSLGILSFDLNPESTSCQQWPCQSYPEAWQDHHHRAPPHLAHSDWWGVDQSGGAAQRSHSGWLWQEEQVSAVQQTPTSECIWKIYFAVWIFPSQILIFFPLSPQCECGIFDPVWNQGHHPGYGDLCSIPAETADRWDREADQRAVSTNSHTDSHCKQTWRWDYHLHHQQLRDADLLFQNWMESQVWKAFGYHTCLFSCKNTARFC